MIKLISLDEYNYFIKNDSSEYWQSLFNGSFNTGSGKMNSLFLKLCGPHPSCYAILLFYN